MLVVFNDTAATEIETYGHPLSLHDALPICTDSTTAAVGRGRRRVLTAPDSHAGTLLEVDDLRTSFVTPRGVVTAVDGVSLSLERGRTLGVVGASGSGMSVLARPLLGLLGHRNPRRSGSVRYARPGPPAPTPQDPRNPWGPGRELAPQTP